VTAFRILDQSPVYFDLQGNLAAGGQLRFYESGTTTPKDVYGDEALTVNNGPEVDIDPDGRADVDIWGDGLGAYRVRLYASDDTLVWERDDVDIQGGGTTIPALDSGAYLTNNGSVLQWLDILQPPDPTGQSGKVLSNNGTSLLWQALATSSANAILTFVTGGIKISDGTTAKLFLFGSDTVAANPSSPVASKAFSYGSTFTSAPQVFATINGSAGVANPGGGIPSSGVSSVGVSSALFNIDTNAFGSTINVTNPVPFFWFAVGPVAA
jgi:hypothetical protein